MHQQLTAVSSFGSCPSVPSSLLSWWNLCARLGKKCWLGFGNLSKSIVSPVQLLPPCGKQEGASFITRNTLNAPCLTGAPLGLSSDDAVHGTVLEDPCTPIDGRRHGRLQRHTSTPSTIQTGAGAHTYPLVCPQWQDISGSPVGHGIYVLSTMPKPQTGRSCLSESASDWQDLAMQHHRGSTALIAERRHPQQTQSPPRSPRGPHRVCCGCLLSAISAVDPL